MLHYVGRRWPSGLCDIAVYVGADKLGRTLPRRRDLVDHSAAFEWGYGGSGPAQTALAILAFMHGDRQALALYQAFKWDVVAQFEAQGWWLTYTDVEAWLRVKPLEPLSSTRS